MLRSQLWSFGWTGGRVATFGYTSTPSLVPQPTGPTYYYPKTLRNIIVSLLDLFDDIQIKDYEADNTTISKIIDVPITFGPVRKYQQLNLQAESGKKYELQVPRLALTYNGTTYDSSRATGTNEARYFYNTKLDIKDIDGFISDIQPAPYNYNFTLYIRTRALDHYAQIIENVLPYFNPALFLRVKEFCFLNIERDLKTTIDSITPEFTDEQDNNSIREVNGTFNITVAGFAYRPITTASIIKKIRYSTFFSQGGLAVLDKEKKIIGTAANSHPGTGAQTPATLPERTYYYPKTLKNIIISMLNMFDKMKVKDYEGTLSTACKDKDLSLSKEINVPITFGPVRKYQQLNLQAESGSKYYLQLPRLALVHTGMAYDSSRATGTNESRYFYDTTLNIKNIDSFFSDVQPTPFNYHFTLYVRTRAMDHYGQILENILPYFNPARFMRLKEFSFLNIERDLKVTLDSVTPEFVEPQDNNNVREVNGTINFTVYGFAYRPVTTAGLIKIIQFSTYYQNENFDSVLDARYTITPSGVVGVSNS
jgi:hypothetical protein